MNREILEAGPLLTPTGELAAVGWSPQPKLDCNLEQVKFYPWLLRPLQRFRLKRWDYYAVFTPRRFFSATIADLGYAGNLFVYTLDFESHNLHEEGLVVPFSRGLHLPRNSTAGVSSYQGQGLRLRFEVESDYRTVEVDWPQFHEKRGISARLRLACPPDHQAMHIVIPFGNGRFYFNRKINCLPAEGWIRYAGEEEQLTPQTSLGQLDWGRGVWPYRSFWLWASASGFLPDGRRIGLNLGEGFGDTSQATENCLILDGKVHKLDQVHFTYDPQDYKRPWQFSDRDGRLQLTLTPFVERVARTDLKIIFSEVHQMFGHYQGRVIADDGETIAIEGLIGFAEEHHARW